MYSNEQLKPHKDNKQTNTTPQPQEIHRITSHQIYGTPQIFPHTEQQAYYNPHLQDPASNQPLLRSQHYLNPHHAPIFEQAYHHTPPPSTIYDQEISIYNQFTTPQDQTEKLNLDDQIWKEILQETNITNAPDQESQGNMNYPLSIQQPEPRGYTPYEPSLFPNSPAPSRPIYSYMEQQTAAQNPYVLNPLHEPTLTPDTRYYHQDKPTSLQEHQEKIQNDLYPSVKTILENIRWQSTPTDPDKIIATANLVNELSRKPETDLVNSNELERLNILGLNLFGGNTVGQVMDAFYREVRLAKNRANTNRHRAKHPDKIKNATNLITQLRDQFVNINPEHRLEDINLISTENYKTLNILKLPPLSGLKIGEVITLFNNKISDLQKKGGR